MSASNATRYLPTLTEVVSPEVVLQAIGPMRPQAGEGRPWADAMDPALELGDTAALTEIVLNKITPLLEQQLRSAAQELFEVQMNVVLPALQLHIEAAVRQAVKEALSERGGRQDCCQGVHY